MDDFGKRTQEDTFVEIEQSGWKKKNQPRGEYKKWHHRRRLRKRKNTVYANLEELEEELDVGEKEIKELGFEVSTETEEMAERREKVERR